MTKAELVEVVSRESGLPRKAAEVVVNAIFRSMREALDAGGKIELRGFGSFRLKTRGARIGRNPKTGDKVHVPLRKIPSFRPGKDLLEILNHSAPHGHD